MHDLPSLMERTFVQSITVGILWATVITVESANSVLIIFCKIMSVALSIDEVASSSTNTLLFLSKARPRQNCCRCPMLQFDPSSSTIDQNINVIINKLTLYEEPSYFDEDLPKESNPCFLSLIASVS